MRPGRRRLEFSTTILGALIAEDFAARQDLVYGLLRQCLLSVVFPNPCTDNIGVSNHRPFRWLLLLGAELDGAITRHEMILGMLSVVNDLESGALEKAVERVRSVRGGSRTVMDSAVADYAAGAGLQITTLENYTRLPVGVLKSPQLGWGHSERIKGLYEKPIDALVLSALGGADAQWLLGSTDVREAELEGFSLDTRAQFANWAYYAMLVRSGLDPSEVESDLRRAAGGCQEILRFFKIETPGDLLYSPIQQASDEVLARAVKIDQVS